MKNINLAPHSSKPVKGEHGNKPFIFISILVLTFLSFACLYIYISTDNKWQNSFGAKIGSFFNFQKPGKLIKLFDSKKNSEVKKHFEQQANREEYVENFDRVEIEFDRVEIEKEKPVLEETDIQTAGIVVEENEDSIEANVPASKIEEKIMPAKGEEKDSYYYIQVCSCVIKDNADKIFRKLGDHGYSPVMKEIVRPVRMHNIYTDDFTKKSDAMEFLNRLKNDGFDSALLPSSGSGYKIRITSCFYMESAKGIIKRLNQLGYETSIRKELIPTRMYSVLLGDFESLEEAEAASDRLIKLGYPKPILKRNTET